MENVVSSGGAAPARTTGNAPQKKFSKAAIAVAAVLTAVGVGCWIYQLMIGLQMTGMTNVNSWGAYIVMFMFFVGLSAGGLIVASSAHVFNIEAFKKVALPAVILSTVCICLAGLFVLIDLGGFAKVWRLLTGPNLTSPLMWDVLVITCYLVINILDIVWIRKGDEAKVAKLSYVALPVAILVHSVTAWIFGLQIARTWYTAIMAPIFVASACDSGLALLLIALMVLQAKGLFTTGTELFEKLAKLLAVFVAVDAYFIFCELLTMGYPGGSEATALAIMATGETAPFFWFEMIGGLLIPFLILAVAKNRSKRGLVDAASLHIVLGVFGQRNWLLLTAFSTPYATAMPGFESDALAQAALSTTGVGAFYVPTGLELLVVVGVLALGCLAFMLLCNGLMGKGGKSN